MSAIPYLMPLILKVLYLLCCTENRMQKHFPLHTVVAKDTWLNNKICAQIRKERFLTDAMLQHFALCVATFVFATSCSTMYLMPANLPVIISKTYLHADL
ncbi:TPA: hypothetical protein ACH3X1_007294 [Trebouxia sp. C0004]